jgi:hypothetical protein
MAEKKLAAKKTLAKPQAKKAAAKPADEKMQPHQIVLSSNVQNAVGIAAWGNFAGEANLQELCNDLGEQTKNVQDGDMRSVEGMLFRQAKTLETMFTNLTRRASKQDNMKWLQTFLTLALKSQAQCRSTLEALAEIKNPRPVSFVKQANIANGNQQVNNTYASASGHSGINSGAGNFQTEPNKLLEADHGQRMDFGAQGKTGRVNQAVATVEAVHRA